MPSTVTSLFAAAGVSSLDIVPWGAVASRDAGPGLYVVSRSSDPDAATAPPKDIDAVRVRDLLAARPELRVDGARPSDADLVKRLAAFAVPNEPALYVGLASKSLHTRLDQFYSTRPGARSPHAGGWPLKYVDGLERCWLHLGRTVGSDVNRAEFRMLAAFLAAVPRHSRSAVVDPALPLPYANLEIRDPDRRTRKRKAHGITKATA